jgi:hypothetical protein
MAKDVVSISAAPVRSRYEVTLDIYLIALSVITMLFGLRHWAVILGIIAGAGGSFEAMSTPWKILTMHMAVVDLVASVGLWMRASWGQVVWVYAALAEIILHIVFASTFGNDWPLVGFHFIAIAVFVVLTILVSRSNVHGR